MTDDGKPFPSEPTSAQRDLIELAGSRFVEACPGSGKTRAIVARFERLARARSRRGVALLSFTNAAVDEVTSRCSDPRALDAPNFVGTFDSFINRFITGPYVSYKTGTYPRFVDTWSAIPGSGVRLAAMKRGISFDLEWFDWSDDRPYSLDRRRVSGRYANVLLATYDSSSAAINKTAEATRRHFVRDRHIISSSTSRQITLWLLNNAATRAIWDRLLADRFAELIIDEAQDCGSEELAVLRVAHAAKVTVVAVADLDQSIFEFRRASPAQIRVFANTIPPGTTLSGNFRSSPAICKLGDLLRHGPAINEPVGDNKNHTAPIRLIAYSETSQVPPLIEAILDEERIPIADCKVLAHRRKDASDCAGASPIGLASGRSALRFARAHLTLSHDLDTSRRRRAIEDAERALLELANAPDPQLHSNQTLAEQLGLDQRWVRDSAMRVALGASPTVGRHHYSKALQGIVRGLSWPGSVVLPNLGKRLATPSETDWAGLALDPPEGLPWGTIHSAKGREFEAVILVIPKTLTPDQDGNTCLDLWETAQDGESRRVLYVGATRARKLLVLAVHKDHYLRVAALTGFPPAAQDVHSTRPGRSR
jgi:DNA helicase II / ATP-dependent DNA helicase PcrA